MEYFLNGITIAVGSYTVWNLPALFHTATTQSGLVNGGNEVLVTGSFTQAGVPRPPGRPASSPTPTATPSPPRGKSASLDAPYTGAMGFNYKLGAGNDQSWREAA